MQEIEVSSERQSGGSAIVKFTIGENLEELKEQFGEEVCLSHVKRSLIIALQAYMRGLMDAGKSPEDIQEAANNWKPGLKKAGKTALERAREEITRMSPADRKALAQEIRERAKSDQAAA